MNKKERIDLLLVERGLFETREQAKRAIMAGLVYADEERIDKPGMKIERTKNVTVKGDVLRYVSRGGLKLEKALDVFELHLNDRVVLDIGASTGGFTDCALQNGAAFVYALDVGYNQLAWKLRNDERVHVMERTNFRYVKPDDFVHGLPNFATIDVSFISLRLILPVLKTIILDGGEVVALIKPQFEAGRDDVGKRGVVRERRIHERVVTDMFEFSLEEGYDVAGIDFSPITGGEGNIEFLLYLRYEKNTDKGKVLTTTTASEVVERAYEQLKND